MRTVSRKPSKVIHTIGYAADELLVGCAIISKELLPGTEIAGTECVSGIAELRCPTIVATATTRWIRKLLIS